MRKLFGCLCASVLLTALATNVPAAPTPAAPKNTAVIDARKRVAEAQAAVKELREEEKRIKDKRRSEFEDKEEWKTTIATYKKTKDAHKLARDQALAAVKAKPEYKTALKNKADLQAKMDELSKKKGSDPDLITRTATKLTTEGITIKKMETGAMDNDGKVIEAKELYAEAEKQMKALDEEVDSSLTSDPDYMALQTQIEQAETALTQAKDALAQAQKSSRPTPTATPRKGKASEGES